MSTFSSKLIGLVSDICWMQFAKEKRALVRLYLAEPGSDTSALGGKRGAAFGEPTAQSK